MTVLTDASSANHPVELVGGSQSNTVQKNWTWNQKVTPSGVNARFASDRFGDILDIDGSVMVVGTPNHPYDANGTNALTNSGTVWIFRNSGSTWAQELRLPSPNRNANDLFGYSVAVSGNTIAVGAPNHSFDANNANEADSAGAVYIFTYDGSAWSLQQKIVATGTNGRVSGDQFGKALDLVGDRLVVGSPFHSFNASGSGSLTGAGAAFVFNRSSGVWTQETIIIPSGTNARNTGDNFGSVIKLSSDANRFFAQSPAQDYDSAGANSVTDAGAIFVFNRTSGAWAQETKLVGSTRQISGNWGNSIDFSASTLVVGSLNQKVNETFTVAGTTWTRTATLAETKINSATVMLLHFDGTSGSTSFTDEADGVLIGGTAYPSSYTQSTSVTASMNTDNARFGTSSLQLAGVNVGGTTPSGTQGGLTINANIRPALGTQDFTIEAWVKPQTFEPNVQASTMDRSLSIASRGAYWTLGLYHHTATTPSPFATVKFGTTTYTLNGTNLLVNPNDWNHVALVRWGNLLSLYLNGTAAQIINIATGSDMGDAAATDAVVLGSTAASKINGFVGFVDEFRIIRKAQYTTATFNLPTDRFRFSEAAALVQGTGTTAAVYDDNQVLLGLPLHGGIEGFEPSSYSATTSQSTQFPGMAIDGGGIVQVMKQSGSTWATDSYLCTPGIGQARRAGDAFGTKIQIDNGNIFVTAPHHARDVTGKRQLTDAGAAFLLTWDGSGTNLTQKFFSTSRRQGALYGTGMSIKGNKILLSAPDYNDVVLTYSETSSSSPPHTVFGRSILWSFSNALVEYWAFSGSSWTVNRTQIPYQGSGSVGGSSLDQYPYWTDHPLPTGTFANNAYLRYGETVVVAGDTLFEVSNPARAPTATGSADHTTNQPNWPAIAGGNVQNIVFDGTNYNETVFTVPGTTTPRNPGDKFGSVVSTDGTTVLATAPFHPYDQTGINPVNGAGAVFSFTKNLSANIWSMDQKILSPVRTANENFGQGISVNNLAAMIGGLGTGIAYLYTKPTITNNWTLFNQWSEGQLYSADFVNTQNILIGNPYKDLNPIANSDSGQATLITSYGHLTSSNVLTYDTVDQTYGGSAVFDGTSTYITVTGGTDFGFTGDYTVMGRIKTSADGVIMSDRKATDTASFPGKLLIRIVSGKVQVTVGTTTVVTSATSVNTGSWVDLAVVRSGSTYRVFINGAIDATATNSTAIVADDITLGWSPDLAVNTRFNGKMENFRVYNSALWTAVYDPSTQPHGQTSTNDSFYANGVLILTLASTIQDFSTSWHQALTDAGKFAPPGQANGRQAGDNFGWAVALDNNLVAIGSPGHSYDNNGAFTATSQGAVQLFEFATVSSRWFFSTKANPGGTLTGANLRYGSDVDLNSGYLAVGNSGGSTRLQIHVENSPGNWSWQDESPSTYAISSSVALVSNVLAVGGMPTYTVKGNANTGGFHWMTRLNTVWSDGPGGSDTLSQNIMIVPATTNGLWANNTVNYELVAMNGRNPNDAFGTSVAISDDKSIIAVGAPNHGYSDTVAGTVMNTGAIFSYVSVPSGYAYQGKITRTGSATTNTGLGTELAFSGSYLITGAPNHNSFRGLSQIYLPTDSTITGTWAVQAELLGSTANEKLGTGVSFATDSLALFGSPGINLNATTAGIGAWNSSTRSGATWSALQGYNEVSGITNGRLAGDTFGTSISISGTRIAIGTPRHTYTPDGQTSAVPNKINGAVFTYNWSGTNWLQEQKVVHTLNTSTLGFAQTIAMENDFMVVGFPSVSQTYTFTLSGGVWTYGATQSQTETNEGFASSLAIIDDSNFVEGSPLLDGTPAEVDAGGFATFNNDGSAWSLQGYTQTPGAVLGEVSGDQFGYSVGLSSDGLLVIGAPFKETKLDGSSAAANTGMIYTYTWNATTTEFDFESQIVNPLNVANENFGVAVDVKGPVILVGSNNGSQNALHIFRRTAPNTYSTEVEQWTNDADNAGRSVALVTQDIATSGSPNSPGALRDFQITNSGTFKYIAYDGSAWDSGDQYQGDDSRDSSQLYVYNGGPGAGGAGYHGGASGEVNRALDVGGQAGMGGLNLVPAGGQEIPGTGTLPGNSADTDRGTAGTGATAAVGSGPSNGSNARIVITWSTGTQTFDYTGADQTFTVPTGETSLTIKAWGAGGGAGQQGLNGSNPGGNGGPGGYVTGTLAVTGGQVLTIVVGQGGNGNANGYGNRADQPAYGDGGWAGIGSKDTTGTGQVAGSGGNGGGMAAIFDATSTPLLIAAGGGGGGGGGYNPANAPGAAGGLGGLGPRAQKLTQQHVAGYANGRSPQDTFGYSVVLGDSFVICGAPGHSFNLAGQEIGLNAGGAFSYRRANQAWTFDNKINMTTPTVNGYFGSGLSLSNNYLLVSASPRYVLAAGNGLPVAGGGVAGQGSFEIFQNTGTDQWSSVGRHDGSSTNSSFYTNQNVLVNDNVSVAPIPMTNQITGSSVVAASGAFKTYTRNTNTWTLMYQNIQPGLSYGRFAQDKFGTKVTVQPNIIAVSAPQHSYSENGITMRTNMGAAYVWRLNPNTNAWTYDSKLTGNTGTQMGSTGLELSGQTLMAATTTTVQTWTYDGSAWNLNTPQVATVTSAAMFGEGAVLTTNIADTVGTGLQPAITGAGGVQEYDYAGSWSVGQHLSVPGSSNGRNANDEFGISVGLSSQGYVAVGSAVHSFNEIGSSRTAKGAIWIFSNPTGSAWTFERKVVSQTNSTASNIGAVIDIQGSYLLSSGSNAGSNQFAELFNRQAPGNWSTVNQITFDSNAGQAASVSMVNSGQIAWGEWQADGTIAGGIALANSGAVRNLLNESGVWTETAALAAPGLVLSRNAQDLFASSMSMNSNYLVIGATGHAYDALGANSTANAGAIWIFRRTATDFELVNMFTAPQADRVVGALYGASVSISPDSQYVSVGMPGSNTVYIYQFTGKTLNLMNKITPPGTSSADDLFGYSVSVNAGRLAIGAPQHDLDATDSNTLMDAGAVYTYKFAGNTWTFIEKITGFSNDKEYSPTDEPGNQMDTTGPNGRMAGDNLGTSVAMSEHRALIAGEPGQDYDDLGANEADNAGAAILKYIR